MDESTEANRGARRLVRLCVVLACLLYRLSCGVVRLLARGGGEREVEIVVQPERISARVADGVTNTNVDRGEIGRLVDAIVALLAGLKGTS